MGDKSSVTKILLALLVIWVAACGGKEEREAKYLARGKEFFTQGDFVKAQLEFRNALQINPKGVDAQYHLGLIAEREGNWQDAFGRFTRVVEENPDHAEAQLKLAQLYLISGDVEKAEAKLPDLERLMPDSADLYAVRANIAVRRGKNQEAQLLAEGALGKKPDHVGAALVLAGALANQGDIEGALLAIDEGLKQSPGEHALHLLKVQLNLVNNRVDDGIAAYRVLVDAAPETFEYRLSLARLLASQDRVGEAEALLRDAVKSGAGGSEAKLAIVDLIAQRVGFVEAEAEAKALIAASPDEHAYSFKLASLYVNNGRTADAEAVLRSVVEKDGEGPSGIEARVNLARQAAARGDGAAADAMIKEVLALEAENSGAILVRGTQLLRAGDVEGALADARTVLRSQPRSAEALRLLAETQLRRREPHLAIETLSQLADVEPENAANRERLGRLHLERRDLDQALLQYDAVLATAPDRFESLLPRAEILIAKRQFSDAEAVIARISALPDRAPTAHLLAGRLNLAQGKVDRAVERFRQAEALTPQADEPVTAIVQTYLTANRPDEVFAYLDEVTARRPDDAFVLNLKGEALAQQGRNEEAADALRLAIAARPDWEAPHANLGNLLVTAGRTDEGVAAYQEGLTKQPDSPRLLYSLAAAQERAGDAAGAIATYETILAKDPNSEIGANNYAALVADFAFEDKAALERAAELVKRFETSNEPFYLDTLGWVQYRRGDYAQARIYLDRAARLRSDVPIIQYHLGMALYRLGEKEAARAALQAATAGEDGYPGKDEAKVTLASLSQS